MTDKEKVAFFEKIMKKHHFEEYLIEMVVINNKHFMIIKLNQEALNCKDDPDDWGLDWMDYDDPDYAKTEAEMEEFARVCDEYDAEWKSFCKYDIKKPQYCEDYFTTFCFDEKGKFGDFDEMAEIYKPMQKEVMKWDFDGSWKDYVKKYNKIKSK